MQCNIFCCIAFFYDLLNNLYKTPNDVIFSKGEKIMTKKE